MAEEQKSSSLFLFELDLPHRWRRLAWAVGIAELGMLLARVPILEVFIPPMLALLTGISSNWST